MIFWHLMTFLWALFFRLIFLKIIKKAKKEWVSEREKMLSFIQKAVPNFLDTVTFKIHAILRNITCIELNTKTQFFFISNPYCNGYGCVCTIVARVFLDVFQLNDDDKITLNLSFFCVFVHAILNYCYYYLQYDIETIRGWRKKLLLKIFIWKKLFCYFLLLLLLYYRVES